MMTQQPQPTPIPATAMLSVQLEAQQWNAVLAALSDAPYRIAAPLIQAMSEQLQTQTLPRQGNGVDLNPVEGIPTTN